MQAQSIDEPPVQPMIGSVDNKLTAIRTMIQTFPNVRFLLVCFASISVALPVGIISVSKLLLFVCALAVIVCGWMGRGDIAANLPSLAADAGTDAHVIAQCRKSIDAQAQQLSALATAH